MKKPSLSTFTKILTIRSFTLILRFRKPLRDLISSIVWEISTSLRKSQRKNFYAVTDSSLTLVTLVISYLSKIVNHSTNVIVECLLKKFITAWFALISSFIKGIIIKKEKQAMSTTIICSRVGMTPKTVAVEIDLLQLHQGFVEIIVSIEKKET